MGSSAHSDAFAAFVAAAERYCALIEGAPYRDREWFVVRADRWLAVLHAGALALDDGFHDGPELPHIPSARWEERFEALQETLGDWAVYWSVLDMDRPDERAGSEHFLDDDLADVWRDLREGLLGLAAGHPPRAVEWHFAFGYRTHWGRHAVEASRALHHRRYG